MPEGGFTTHARSDEVAWELLDFNVMKILSIISKRNSLLVLPLLFSFSALALEIQAQTSAPQRANVLHTQLLEVQSKKADLEASLKRLEEESKPENIEKGLAGIGSTHPEDLREARRRQLEIEKTSIQTQLKLLTDSQTRLERGIAQADADVYHQSARINAEVNQQRSAEEKPASAPSVKPSPRRTRSKVRRRAVYRLVQD